MPSATRDPQSFETRLTSISRQAGIIFLEKIGFQFIMFASSILLARILGTTLLGRYQLGLVVVQLLSVLTVMGFDRGLIRFIPVYYPHEPGKTKKIVLDSLFISFIASAILGALLYLNASAIALHIFHSEAMINVFRVFSLYLPIYTIMIVGTAAFNGFKRSDIFSHITNIFIPVIFTVLLFVLFFAGQRLYPVIYVRMLSVVISITIVIYFLKRNFSDVFASRKIVYDVRKYIQYSLPLLVIGLLYYFIGRVDILMLGYFLDSSQVGIYSVIVNISSLCIFGLHSVNKIFSPNISELYVLGDFKSLEGLLKTLTKWIFYLSLLLFFFIAIFSGELMRMFGPSFIAGGTALIILSFGQLINSLAGPTGAVLLMTGKQNWEVFNSVSIIILNVLLNYFLIPRFGIEGAAMSTAIALTSINILKLLETYKEFKIHPYSASFSKGISAIVIGAVLVYFSKGFLVSLGLHYLLLLAISFIVFVLIFFGIMYFLRYDDEDRLILSKIAAKINPGKRNRKT